MNSDNRVVKTFLRHCVEIALCRKLHNLIVIRLSGVVEKTVETAFIELTRMCFAPSTVSIFLPRGVREQEDEHSTFHDQVRNRLSNTLSSLARPAFYVEE